MWSRRLSLATRSKPLGTCWLMVAKSCHHPNPSHVHISLHFLSVTRGIASLDSCSSADLTPSFAIGPKPYCQGQGTKMSQTMSQNWAVPLFRRVWSQTKHRHITPLPNSMHKKASCFFWNLHFLICRLNMLGWILLELATRSVFPESTKKKHPRADSRPVSPNCA